MCECVSVQFAPVRSFAMKVAVPGSGSYLISGSPFFLSSLESFLWNEPVLCASSSSERRTIVDVFCCCSWVF